MRRRARGAHRLFKIDCRLPVLDWTGGNRFFTLKDVMTFARRRLGLTGWRHTTKLLGGDGQHSDGLSRGRIRSRLSDAAILKLEGELKTHVFSRNEVARGDIHGFVRVYASEKLPRGQELLGMMNSFVFKVEG